jgi:hypothetical protein
MVKTLLVYEDFNELTLTESYLKKVGFDVIGISNEVLIQDQILGFNPDIIVAHGKNLKVSSFSVGQKLKENHKYTGKVVIVVPHGVRPAPEEIMRIKMDAVIEAPVNPEKLIQVLARLGRVPSAPLLEKFHRARMADPDLERAVAVARASELAAQAPTSEEATSSKIFIPIQDTARAQKYSNVIKSTKIDPSTTTFERKEVRDRQKEMKKDWDFDEMEEMDQLRREFAEALFKKGK